MANITYFAGGSFDALTPGPSNVVDDAATINIRNNSSYADAMLVDPETGAKGEFQRVWTHINSQIQYFTDRFVLFTWYNKAGTAVVRLVANNGIEPQYWNGSVWIALANAANISGDGQIDLLINISKTAGKIALFWKGGLIVSADKLDLSGLGGISLLRCTGSLTVNHTVSQIIMANYNTIGHTVRRRSPIAAGKAQQWVGTYNDIDDGPVDDTDAINTIVTGDASTFQGTPLSATPTGSVIKAVVVAARLRNDGGEVPTNAEATLGIGNALHGAGYNLAIAEGYVAATASFDRNPATGLPWASISEVNATEFGLTARE